MSAVIIQPSPKSGVTTLLLCLFLGALGVHRFYVGKIGTGILMLITGGGLGIWQLIDLVVIGCGKFTDKEGRTIMFGNENKSPLRIVLTTLGLIFAALIIYVILLFSLMMYVTSGITTAVRSELDILKQGDYTKAYQATSKEFQQATSLETFKDFVKQHPALQNNADASFPQRSMDSDRGILTGTLRAQDGTTEQFQFLLIKEDGVWKIFSIETSSQSGIKE